MVYEDFEAEVGKTVLHAVPTGASGEREIAERVFRIELSHLDFEEATFDVWSHDNDADGFRVPGGVFKHGRHTLDISGHATRESVLDAVARMANPGLFARYPNIESRHEQAPSAHGF